MPPLDEEVGVPLQPFVLCATARADCDGALVIRSLGLSPQVDVQEFYATRTFVNDVRLGLERHDKGLIRKRRVLADEVRVLSSSNLKGRGDEVGREQQVAGHIATLKDGHPPRLDDARHAVREGAGLQLNPRWLGPERQLVRLGCWGRRQVARVAMVGNVVMDADALGAFPRNADVPHDRARLRLLTV